MTAGLAYHASQRNRLFGDWNIGQSDPNDEWWLEAGTIASRAWDLFNNNPYARALVETDIAGVFGSKGLEFRSTYSEDDDPAVSESELAVRRSINKYVSRVTRGTRPDVAGLMSWVDMHRALRIARRVVGDGFAVRVWKPGRPQAVAGTCWRLIDPARVSNPSFGANSKTMFEGFELDADGQPVAIHVLNTHPNIIRYRDKMVWTRVAIHAPDGTRNVIHCRPVGRADQIRGISAFAPCMEDLKHLGDLKLAWVVAKKANASIAYFINTKDPTKAAASDRNGAVINGTVGIKPLMKYYLPTDDKIQSFNFPYQGAEFDELLMSIMQGVCAPWTFPVEIVLRRLTRSNLASSRSALLDYYQANTRGQDEHIEQAAHPMVCAHIREGLDRGEIEAPDGADIDRLCEGRFLRPARVWPDPKKEAEAAGLWIALGRSRSSAFAEVGMEFQDEVTELRQDEDYAEAQGVDLPTPGATASAAPGSPAVDDNGDPIDPNSDETPTPPAEPVKKPAAVDPISLAPLSMSSVEPAPVVVNLSINNPAQAPVERSYTLERQPNGGIKVSTKPVETTEAPADGE
jgi:lambda family phage portal protein